MLLAASFVLGLFIGSFLNVVIHRLPRGESLAWPGSHCPACAAPIAPYDNIPVLSFALLRGRCRRCRARISPRYPLVELACGAAFAGIALAHGPTPTAALLACFAALLIASAGIDYDEQWIPDRCSLGGLLLGLALMPLAHAAEGAPYAHALAHAARGAATGAGILWCVGFAHARLCASIGRRFPHWPALDAATLETARDGAPLDAGGAADADDAAGDADAARASVADAADEAAGAADARAPFPRASELDYWFWFPGLGMGDVKLLAMVGAFLGATGALWTLVGASVAGAALGLWHLRAHGDSRQPFGFAPAIALAALLIAIFGGGAL